MLRGARLEGLGVGSWGGAGRLVASVRRKTPGVSWWNKAWGTLDPRGMGLDVSRDHPGPLDPDKRDLTPFPILGSPP